MAQDIIKKIHYLTPWLHPIVDVPKKRTTDVLLCMAFTKLNKYVKSPQPTPWQTV
jgi:hypothetical protein